MTTHRRHDLLFLSGEGYREAARFAELVSPPGAPEFTYKLPMEGIPAIVKMQENYVEDWLEVGFSLPEKYRGNRVRVKSRVRTGEIAARLTPFDLAGEEHRKNRPRCAALELLEDAVRGEGFEIGFFGSVAMQIATGHPYFSEGSDIDIYVKSSEEHPKVKRLFQKISTIEERECIRIDCEILYRDMDIKLKELFSGQATIIARGLKGAQIIDIPARIYI